MRHVTTYINQTPAWITVWYRSYFGCVTQPLLDPGLAVMFFTVDLPPDRLYHTPKSFTQEPWLDSAVASAL